jgi:hypothetical protein
MSRRQRSSSTRPICFRTLSKRKRDKTDAGPFGDDWEFLNHERILPPNADFLDEIIKTGVTKELLTKSLATVETSIVKVETSIVKMGSALEDVAKVTLERFISNERDSMLIADAIQSLKGNLRAPSVLDEKKSSST